MIASTSVDDRGDEEINEIYLSAAVTPVALYEIYDTLAEDGHRTAEFDLEVKTGGGTYLISRVPSSMLNDPRKFLSLIPGGVGETITMRPRSGEDIGEAIRVAAGMAGADLPVKQRHKNSGWQLCSTRAADGVTEEHYRYVAGNIAIGAKDSTEDVSAIVREPTLKGFNVKDPHDISRADHQAAIRKFLDVGDRMLVDPSPWFLANGLMYAAAAGLEEIGGVIIVGDPASGKTHMVKSICSAQTGHWKGTLSNFEGTKNFVAGVGEGVHHAVVGVDDLRNRTVGSHKAKEDQNDAFAAIMRMAYGGSEYAKGRQGVDHGGTGDVYSKAKRGNQPGFLLTAETTALPRDGADSNMTRGIFCEVTYDSTFRPGAAAEIKEIALDGAFHTVRVGFLTYIARELDNRGGMELHQERLKQLSHEFALRLKREFPGYGTSRVYEITGRLLAGYFTLLEYFDTMDVFDEETRERGRHNVELFETVAAAMDRSWKTFQGGQETVGALDKLKDAVASRTAYIEGQAFSEAVYANGAGRLGFVTKTRAEGHVVHLIPDMAMKITGMARQDLNNSLAPYLIMKKGEGFLRKVNSTLPRMYAIKLDTWGGQPAAGTLRSIATAATPTHEDEDFDYAPDSAFLSGHGWDENQAAA
ncbi:hypothetical protein [Arthrobacter sp. H20]|uniref:hypothetical protein n=1 Tax=Arthrobacter sp. H20 TaxID=1267981 RepID=UPI00047B00D6|nr:hypothetical protein [Arthrobacter sp. H20]